MLKPAILYKTELENKIYETISNDKYKFFHHQSYVDKYVIQDNTWNDLQFVSIKNDELIGLMDVSINRKNNIANGFMLIRFNDDKKYSLTWAVDLKSFLVSLFKQYNFRKLTFSVIVGNPIEKSYDKIIKKYNGRIVGTYKEHTRLWDGKDYDFKMYEIMNPFKGTK